MKLDHTSAQPRPCDQLPREPWAEARASSPVGKILCVLSHIADIGGSQHCPLGEDNRGFHAWPLPDPAPRPSSLRRSLLFAAMNHTHECSSFSERCGPPSELWKLKTIFGTRKWRPSPWSLLSPKAAT